MKTLSVIIVLIFFKTICFAQEEYDILTAQDKYEFLTDKANSVDVVVEGKIVNKRVFHDSNLNFNITEYKVEVFRQFKGEISSDVYFYMQGGIDEFGKGQSFSHVPSLSGDQVGVFFLKNYKMFSKTYLMPAGKRSILRYDYSGNKVRAYVPGYEYYDLLREVYKPLQNCLDCYNKQEKKCSWIQRFFPRKQDK